MGKEINQEKRVEKNQSKRKKKKKKNREEEVDEVTRDVRVNTSGNVRESACACTLAKRCTGAMNVGTRGGKLVPRTNTRLQVKRLVASMHSRLHVYVSSLRAIPQVRYGSSASLNIQNRTLRYVTRGGKGLPVNVNRNTAPRRPLDAALLI